jgi:NTP pyrophosphatase (non-canonical NTP hydrolase)
MDLYDKPNLKSEVAGRAASELTHICHGAAAAAGWWTDPKTGEPIDLATPNLVPAKLMLIVSEVAEAMEGDRKKRMDDHLPHHKMLEVELADAAIRIFDLAGALGTDLGMIIREKLEYNAQRADHKLANRAAEGGKGY